MPAISRRVAAPLRSSCSRNAASGVVAAGRKSVMSLRSSTWRSSSGKAAASSAIATKTRQKRITARGSPSAACGRHCPAFRPPRGSPATFQRDALHRAAQAQGSRHQRDAPLCGVAADGDLVELPQRRGVAGQRGAQGFDQRADLGRGIERNGLAQPRCGRSMVRRSPSTRKVSGAGSSVRFSSRSGARQASVPRETIGRSSSGTSFSSTKVAREAGTARSAAMTCASGSGAWAASGSIRAARRPHRDALARSIAPVTRRLPRTHRN